MSQYGLLFFQRLGNLYTMGHRGLGYAVATAFALVLATMAQPASAAGGIRKWTDAKGVVHYTNVANDQATAGAKGSFVTSPGSATRQRAIYKSRGANGVVHYSDRKPRNASYVVVSFYCPACDPKSPIDWTRTRLNINAYRAEIDTNAASWGVDPALVRAIVHAESAFNPKARSHKGAQGLMQLMPGTAMQYGVIDAYDAAENIRGGVQHLAGLLKKYNGDIRLVAAAYNAGEGAVKKYGGVPPYDETRVYVERVGTLVKRYQSGS